MSNKVNISQVDRKVLILSTDLLASDGVLVGDVIPVSGLTQIDGFVFSDIPSAPNGLIIEQGLKEADFPANAAATTLISHSVFSYIGDIVTNRYTVRIVAPFARIIYTNASSAQNSFRIFFEGKPL